MVEIMFRKLLTLSLAMQFTAGKMSMFFSGVTLATVLSMKFHISFFFALIVCFGVVLITCFIIIKSGWMAKEYNRINQINGLESLIKKEQEK